MMEDLEAIEDTFSRRLELLDKEFISNLKNPQGRTVSVLEREYRDKLKAETEEYEQKFNAFLKSNKKTKANFVNPNRIMPKKEEEKEEGLNMDKPYVATRLEMGRSMSEIAQTKKQIAKFKRYVRGRNLFHKHVPGWYLTNYFRMKIFWKRFKLGFSDMVFRAQSGTKQDFSDLADISRDSLKESTIYLKSKIGLITKWFNKKILRKKSEGEGEKSEDQKIAEKLLKKK